MRPERRHLEGIECRSPASDCSNAWPELIQPIVVRSCTSGRRTIARQGVYASEWRLQVHRGSAVRFGGPESLPAACLGGSFCALVRYSSVGWAGFPCWLVMPSIRIHPFSIYMKDFLLSIVRRTIRFKVIPVRDLVLSGEASTDWTSVGDDPVFDLESEDEGKSIPLGWVYVESRMIRRGANLVARLHVDTGSGFSDADSFVIPAARSGNIKQIIRIPRNTRRLRLSPMRGKGAVRLEFLRITEISCVERVARMVEWTAGDIIKFKNTGRAKKYNITWGRLLTDLKGGVCRLRKIALPFRFDGLQVIRGKIRYTASIRY